MERMFRTYPGAVNDLLQTYNTDEVIVEADRAWNR